MKTAIKSLGAAAMAALFIGAPLTAHALFEDNDARRSILELRRQINDLSARVDAKLEPLLLRVDGKADTKSVIDLANEMDRLRQEIAGLRGQIEVLSNELANAQRRQKDFYADLDQRLRAIEQKQSALDNKAAELTASEQKTFDAALVQFKSQDYRGAAQSLSSFLQKYPESTYLPQAYFWLGSSHYALGDCSSAIPAFQTVVARFASSPRAPDAMLSLAECQIDMKDKAAARESLSNLVKRYPSTPAAAAAKERLAELK